MAACAHAPPPGSVTPHQRTVGACDGNPRDVVHVRFLSGAGVQIWRRGTDEILTPPSYSNPSVWAIALRLPFRANRERIDAWLPDVSGVRAILVGHAHYDHLASVPFILEERAPDATVYASRTAQHLLAGAGLEERVVPLNDVMGNWERPGAWIYLPDGNVPEDFASQAENAWTNCMRILEHNGMRMKDVVKITHFITDAANLPAYNEVRLKFLGKDKPASTLLIVAGLARPELLIEVEMVAAKP